MSFILSPLNGSLKITKQNHHIFKSLLTSSLINLNKYNKNYLNYSTKSHKEPEKTALHNFHVEKNGKIVDFAGYLLPVQYNDMSISASHLHTRKSASIFDVSHMLQTYMNGKDVVECFEFICTADIKGLPHNTGTLTVFTNENGKILDDLIVTKIRDDLLYIVSNAAMKQQDMKIMEDAVRHFRARGKDVFIEFLTPSEQSLIALQGPKAAEGLQKFTKVDLKKLYFMNTTMCELFGVRDCRITRCGYTGEDGFEISIPSENVKDIVENILNYNNGDTIKLAGLGARDSLRLEAGLCLYGSDIDNTITPVEAGLTWLVAPRRRNEPNFPGGTKIVEQIKNGVEKQRVGIKMSSGPPARHGAIICNENGQEIGHITSGCPSPSLGGNVAMGYIEKEYKKIGTKIQLNIRNKLYTTEIAKMPFIKTNYYMKPKDV
ncbi:aminomethyltransferase, mitochondrial [Condylostylus longicornis]|uniref:aminomethyltransferase, mitochondrial n=1 Tax=Condylostylus longicornis TaxID=2530218 RepID=UPI00244DFC8D|nr:aminomethyltransferase, mitochondrial [Condylostylus longicornis]